MLRTAIVVGMVGSFWAAAEPEKARSAVVQRGEYLVSFGGCSGCHTPLQRDPNTHRLAPDKSHAFSGHPEGGHDANGKLGEGDLLLVGASGTAYATAFGTVYASNITPDVDTGIGSWTEEMFVRAMRTGKHMGGQGRPILPPMHWDVVGRLSLDDLKAIFAYLRSLPPVRNDVPTSRVSDDVLSMIDKMNQHLAAQLKAAESH